jgi:hypothetical protein
VISIEDPVEQILKGITQISVNTKAGITYASSVLNTKWPLKLAWNTYFAISASLISPIKMTSGSHRSIVMYAQKELNLNVISIEDPVEQILKGITQISVNTSNVLNTKWPLKLAWNTYFAISASLISPIKMTSGSY